MVSSLSDGFWQHFREQEEAWGLFFWGEHWALRLAGSLMATSGGAIIAGAIARQRSMLCAALSATPAALAWTYMAIAGWTSSMPFVPSIPRVDISLGNCITATVLTFATVPLAGWAGGVGGELVEPVAKHFDTRPSSLFGIKWFHFLWLPVLLHLVLLQFGAAGLYTFVWIKEAWKSSDSIFGLVPTLFGLALWGTFSLMFTGLGRAYLVLSGLEPVEGFAARAVAVLKNGFGMPALAGVLQFAIYMLHYGITRLFS